MEDGNENVRRSPSLSRQASTPAAGSADLASAVVGTAGETLFCASDWAGFDGSEDAAFGASLVARLGKSLVAGLAASASEDFGASLAARLGNSLAAGVASATEGFGASTSTAGLAVSIPGGFAGSATEVSSAASRGAAGFEDSVSSAAGGGSGCVGLVSSFISLLMVSDVGGLISSECAFSGLVFSRPGFSGVGFSVVSECACGAAVACWSRVASASGSAFGFSARWKATSMM